ncbi:Metallo-dependent phosphatase [Annulohypoxylon maeteangense]|uniref:Metallo-dependent phosphatase n=1 Tax=Annulohypoxylon maeteangense TaxID=1927788 RepID=UPI002008C668|nr:Metallo-dependent phosphatase [Annulohypoxylon maeteangense]KAI0883991.1 Metallo-dependent phosphatase [Annulohypoxylon maeteangense]
MGSPDSPPPRAQRRNPQRRQLVGTSIILTLLVFILCYTRSPSTLQKIFTMTPISPMASPDSLPDLTHPHLLASLPSTALPKPGSPGRLIVIGDVHGQLTALDALLAKVKYNGARGDRVVFTGDMVNKGPDSSGVINRAIEIDAFGVRGNHEDRVLRAWKKLHRGGGGGGKKGGKKHVKAEDEDKDEGDSSGEETKEEEEDGKITKSSARDRSTAATLTPAQVTWLAKLPVILRVGVVSPHYGDVIVVHAGLVPGIPLEEQDPWAVMNMRTLISRSRSHSVSTPSIDSIPDSPTTEDTSTLKHPTFKPSKGREGRPWSKVWNEAQKENTKTEKEGKNKGKKEHRTTVIYGHDAKVGLSIRRYAFGLDSSCVTGGDLTALVLESASGSNSASTSDPVYKQQDSGDEATDVDEQAKHGITHRIVSVPCEDGSHNGKGGKKKHKDKGKGDKKHKDHKS